MNDKEGDKITNSKPSNLEQVHKSNKDTIGIHKVDQYGLSAIVRELRINGVSFENIAKELNEKYLKGDMPKMSKMAVHRWCYENNIQKNGQLNTEAAVNIYKHECDMLDTVDQALSLIEVTFDDFRNTIDEGGTPGVVAMKDLTTALTRLITQKQSLVNSIGVTQEKIYNYIAVTEIVNTIMEMVKEKDIGLYAEIKNNIGNNPMLLESFRRIKG